ncbi:MAG: bifunctional adenosylcobinamide kinase/adenosylcobinamide-phosphate guanylyltransferase [Candidatus Omnitrophota bacterium]|nr:bifunctional adenosylcobinamide kinase/adenosylcobinamide-phosphate guanylyltransferase [Candidatus Omnitrophota bacterium]
MGKITFILGGARSGKSSYAIELAKSLDKKVAFIATGIPFDREMKERIQMHKKRRPSYWRIFEEPKGVPLLLKKIGSTYNVIIVDCLTLFISNLLLECLTDNAIENKVKKILKVLKSTKCKSILVSNEVGLGIVPDNNLGRRFRDLVGKINQQVASSADEIILMVSGVPLILKKK